MADNKKYYYMRLKENFFDDESMKILESMQDGYLYSNILLKMYLASLKSEGRLMLNNLIPYNAAMIASVTGHQVGTVEKALEVFRAMGLIEVLDNGAIYMLNIQNFIGQGSTEADRIRKYQRRIKAEEEGVEIYEKSTPEIEIKIDTEKEIEREKKPTKHKHGEYQNVLLTDAELEKLKQEYPDYLERIERLSEYIASSGKAYKSHYATIRAWARKDKEKAKPKGTGFSNAPERKQDFDDIQRRLIQAQNGGR